MLINKSHVKHIHETLLQTKKENAQKLCGNGHNSFAKNLEQVVIGFWFRGEFRPKERRNSLTINLLKQGQSKTKPFITSNAL